MINETIHKGYGNLSFVEAINVFPWKCIRYLINEISKKGFNISDSWDYDEQDVNKRKRNSSKELKRSFDRDSNPFYKGSIDLNFSYGDEKNRFSVRFLDQRSRQDIFQVSISSKYKRIVIDIPLHVSLNKVSKMIVTNLMELRDFVSDEYEYVAPEKSLFEKEIQSAIKRLEILFKDSFLSMKESDYTGTHKYKIFRSKDYGSDSDSIYTNVVFFITLNTEDLNVRLDDEIQQKLFELEMSRKIYAITKIIKRNGLKLSNISFPDRRYDCNISASTVKGTINDLIRSRNIDELEDRVFVNIDEFIKEIKTNDVLKSMVQSIFENKIKE